jgi:hypothetical protein
MTLNKFIKELQKLEKKYGKRKKVVVEWESFASDDFTHFQVNKIDAQVINWSNGENFYLKNGEERQRLVITLKGRP